MTGEYTLHVFVAESTSLAGSTACPVRFEAHVARQPIFDRHKKLFAYELLYRHGNVDAVRIADGEQATASVVTASFLDIGLRRIVGESPAFINATHEFLVSRAALALPPEKVVLEIREDAVVDEALKALRCVFAYERGDWERSLHHSCGVSQEEFADFYTKSVQWADTIIAEFNQ